MRDDERLDDDEFDDFEGAASEPDFGPVVAEDHCASAEPDFGPNSRSRIQSRRRTSGGCGCVVLLILIGIGGYAVVASLRDGDDPSEVEPPNRADAAPAATSEDAPSAEDPAPSPSATSPVRVADVSESSEPANANARLWEDVQGRVVEAELAAFRNGSVELVAGDGTSREIPVASLSIADRKHLLERASDPEAPLDGLTVRIWSDATGRFQVEAAALSVDGTSVKLLRTDGEAIDVPLSSLSAEDAGFLETALPPF